MTDAIGVNYDVKTASYPVITANEENFYEKYNLMGSKGDVRLQFDADFEYKDNKWFRVRAIMNGGAQNDEWVKC